MITTEPYPARESGKTMNYAPMQVLLDYSPVYTRCRPTVVLSNCPDRAQWNSYPS